MFPPDILIWNKNGIYYLTNFLSFEQTSTNSTSLNSEKAKYEQKIKKRFLNCLSLVGNV